MQFLCDAEMLEKAGGGQGRPHGLLKWSDGHQKEQKTPAGQQEPSVSGQIAD